MRLPSNIEQRLLPQANVQRSAFDRKQSYKTTFNAGYLIPFYLDMMYPGDTFNFNATLFARLNTPIFPIMDNAYLDSAYFFVPYRLIWNNFQKFCGEQVDPGDSIDYLLPTVASPDGTGFTVGSLADYFGFPTGVTGITVEAAPFRAYNLIWNEWYRDQNLQDSLVVDRDDGPDDIADYVLKRRNKRHDYFTSCLPWPQKGEDVTIPLTGDAPVLGIGKYNTSFGITNQTVYESGSGTAQTFATCAQIADADNNKFYVEKALTANIPWIRADMSEVTAQTINDLREAFQMQKFLEKMARGGTRYTEIVKQMFGVTSPDARLQRPEFLGGASTPLSITPVMQTSESGTTPQGNLAAFGQVVSNREGFTYSATEHGIIIGLCMVRADLNYQQGIPRIWKKSTRYELLWPQFAHLGEQEVLNQEIYATGTTTDDDVFGYQPRYEEYRYGYSKITGELRSTFATSLDAWHLAQEFASLPLLNSTFIEENPPFDRVVAVAGTHFTLDAFMKIRSVRPLPMYGTPGLIDHF